jgi:hypothetical protein
MISGDYDSILENNFKEELSWMEEEFDLLFSSKKGNFTELDIKMAKKILTDVQENKNVLNTDKLNTLFALTIEKIKEKYPEFF